MAVHEITTGFQWLYSVLSGDSTLTALLGDGAQGIWRAYAPPSTVPPYVIMSYQSGSDVITMNAFRLMVSGLYQVKIVGPAANMTPLAQGAERIDQLLGLTSGTPTGAVVLACYREQPIFLDELVNGEVWSNAGGMYRLYIEQTP